MRKLTLLATGLLLTSTAYAGETTVVKETTLTTYATPSAELAYEAGYNLIDRIKAMPQKELKNTLPSYADTQVRDIKVDDFKVTIEEFSKERGKIQYRALVSVDYNYSAYENNN